MSRTVERVAEAIYTEYQRRAICFGWTIAGTVAWEELAETSKDDYRATAKAAIAAIRVVYLLSTYGEHGAEGVRATLDGDKVAAMLKLGFGGPAALTDWVSETLEGALAAEPLGTANGGDPICLSSGWGGVQLHVIEIDELLEGL